MSDIAEIQFKHGTLERYGLPDILYPVPQSELKNLIIRGGELPFGMLLHYLQQRSRDGKANWQQDEPAMDRLACLLAHEDSQELVIANGDNWWLEIGPVDLNGKLVTIQRNNSLIAAICRGEDGRLRVAVFRPLDAKSASYLIGLSRTPHPIHGVSMRENNWEYALDASAGRGNMYAADAG